MVQFLTVGLIPMEHGRRQQQGISNSKLLFLSATATCLTVYGTTVDYGTFIIIIIPL